MKAATEYTFGRTGKFKLPDRPAKPHQAQWQDELKSIGIEEFVASKARPALKPISLEEGVDAFRMAHALVVAQGVNADGELKIDDCLTISDRPWIPKRPTANDPGLRSLDVIYHGEVVLSAHWRGKSTMLLKWREGPWEQILRRVHDELLCRRPLTG